MRSFNKFGLNQNILDSIKELKFKNPTSIQDKVIPQILSSEHDIIATAQTGTGKTAAFGLPIISLTINHSKNIEGVILCPTRELCIQISKDLNVFSKYMDHYKIIPIYGGTKIESQIRGLRNNPKIIVCTPGRLNDLILRKKVNLSQVKYFVLDEADEMLSMGFKTEIDKVLNEIPVDRKIYLFSATLSEKVKNITDSYMKKPLIISVSNPNKGADTVKHIYYISNKNKRYDIIRNIIDINKDIYTIIFCRTRRETKEVSKKLIQDNYNAKVLNGDLSQNERDNVMNQFRSKGINILVATDVASRGIDVNNLSHIINYNLPDDPEVYVHRSGRTGRAGKNGLSIVFISSKEYKRLDEIKRLSKISFEKKDIPDEKEILNSRMSLLINKITSLPIPSEKDRESFKFLC
ncbi:MAG: DEAD/DEAH box helicase, partial [Candidatus Marinimicrobia bacterium]|nr:DEAD/DEAH box helicase [Candidatus Neomarinimicrobiota bacterium]